MQRNPALDHIALTLADPCHVGRYRTALIIVPNWAA